MNSTSFEKGSDDALLSTHTQGCPHPHQHDSTPLRLMHLSSKTRGWPPSDGGRRTHPSSWGSVAGIHTAGSASLAPAEWGEAARPASCLIEKPSGLHTPISTVVDNIKNTCIFKWLRYAESIGSPSPHTQEAPLVSPPRSTTPNWILYHSAQILAIGIYPLGHCVALDSPRADCYKSTLVFERDQGSPGESG